MKSSVFAVIAAVFLSACASNPPPSPPVSNGSNEVGTASVPGSRSVRSVPTADIPMGVDHLPYIDVALNERAVYAQFGEQLHDRYTRIQIVSLLPDAYNVEGLIDGTRRTELERRNYEDESRGWFSRALRAKSVTRALMAEFNVSDPDITATKALFSSSFSSNNQEGESWTTNEAIALYATPYFRVGANTTIEATIRMQAADQRERATSANVLSALTSAANAIAPATILVTAFTSPRLKEASSFLDNSVSTLFGQSITEESVSAFSVKRWTAEPVLVIDAQLPDQGDITDTEDTSGAGRWAVYLDEPVPSILSASVKNGHMPDYSDVTAGDILAFKVGEDLTVYDFIFSRLDLSTRVAVMNAAPDPNLARQICMRIDRGMSEIGFNSYDSAAAVWAAATSDQFNQLPAAILKSPSTCNAMQRWYEITNS